MAAREPVGPAAIELGRAIAYYREARKWDTRRVANATSAPQSTVEDWEAGRDVPSFSQWASLKGAVHHSLNRHSELYQRARKEQGFETQDPVPTRLTSVGEAIAAALPVVDQKTSQTLLDVVPAGGLADPPPTTRKQRTNAGGDRSTASRLVRIEWARAQLKLRPHMPAQGPDGLVTLMRERFGVGLEYETLAALKREVKGTEPEAMQRTRGVTDLQPSQLDLAGTFEAATQMVLEAVPNLASFTITVDADTGEAKVDYSVRQVTVVERSGSIKVGKKS
jgi:hypothetical protein